MFESLEVLLYYAIVASVSSLYRESTDYDGILEWFLIIIMKALKCITLGAFVIVTYTYIHGNMHNIRGQKRECTGKYTEIWQRQKF